MASPRGAALAPILTPASIPAGSGGALAAAPAARRALGAGAGLRAGADGAGTGVGVRRLVMRALLELGQCLVGVEGWRGGQLPLERGGTGAAGMVQRLLGGAAEGMEHGDGEADGAGGGAAGADRGPPAPGGEGLWIVDVASRHAGETQEVLGKKQHIGAAEGEPEVQLAERFAVHVAGH